MSVIACTHLDISVVGVITYSLGVMYPIVLVWTSNCDKASASGPVPRLALQ